MEKHTFKITIKGESIQEAAKKVKALAVLASHLSANAIETFAKVVQADPAKVQFAKDFLGIKD